METGESKLFKVGQQSGSTGRANVVVQAQRLIAESPLCGAFGCLFCPGLPRGLDKATPLEAICFTQSTNFNVGLPQNTLTEASRIMFDYVSGQRGPTSGHKVILTVFLLCLEDGQGDVRSLAQYCVVVKNGLQSPSLNPSSSIHLPRDPGKETSPEC